ncbi:hypothetical protein [Paragemmobacter straminiformis]|uniref:DUF4760 domain-containing protein n=1 Tax=Paragemmobacter straminiformis TaxID=2045119 RepID=A0A842IC72_9RHOB|nr:hypothetical protein [Gemmobacter straminiformis]MBC2837622.1 hypothetical protein [Gemmobacter straminiformis]
MSDLFSRLGSPEWQWIWAALQTFTLIGGFYFVIRQIRLAQVQNSISHLNFFREIWISPAILRARRSFNAAPVVADGEIRAHEDVMCLFFNDIGIAIRTGQVDKVHVVRFFGFFVEGYWLLMSEQIQRCRDRASDPSIYGSFERLYEIVIQENERYGLGTLTASRLGMFVKEEAALANFYLDAPA